ncbi:hypothetical protein [Paroceanicella profunda]|nr:hypothetical protein [Paroceanicella profunda]
MFRPAHTGATDRPDVATPGGHRFLPGSFGITVLRDGMLPPPGLHPIFGADREAGEVAARMEENCLPTGRLVGRFDPVPVNTGAERILFHAGNAPEGRDHGTGRMLPHIMAARHTPLRTRRLRLRRVSGVCRPG